MSAALPVIQSANASNGCCAATFFDGLKPSSQAFERLAREVSFPAEALLFVEGQPSQAVMIVVSGQVKLSTASSDGHTVVVRIAGPGEVLGLSAAVVGRPCDLTAEALQSCRMKVIPRESFRQWLRANPELAFRIAQELADEYNNTCHQLRTMLLSHTATQRLARTLLQFARNARPGNEARVPLSLTHQQIAEIIGSSRETVTRLLASFRHKVW